MSATNLRDLALAWLERNAPRNTSWNTPVEQVERSVPPPHPSGTPQSLVAHSEAASVPLFHPIGRGTAEHEAAKPAKMERTAEHFAEQNDALNPVWPPGWRACFLADVAYRPEGVRHLDWRGARLGAEYFGDAYAVRLQVLGWSYPELFNVPAHWGRLDQRGAAFFVRARPVLDITGDAITYQADDRNRLTVRRRECGKQDRTGGARHA